MIKSGLCLSCCSACCSSLQRFCLVLCLVVGVRVSVCVMYCSSEWHALGGFQVEGVWCALFGERTEVVGYA